MRQTLRHLASRLGHSFTDPALLEQALSHRSAAGRSYERLEFLGDAVLNFLITEALFERFPHAQEGELTRLRARLVRGETLAAIARGLELGQFLRLGGGELKSGGRDRDSILADALEAVVGAVYWDAGMEPCRRTVRALFESRLAAISTGDTGKDAKTRLQEHLQAVGLPLPEYRVVEERGAAHERWFTVECRAHGLAAPALGQAASRRKAEQAAAAKALASLHQG